MTILHIDPLGTTSLACTTTTAIDYVDDAKALGTTAAGVATTIALNGGVHTKHVDLTIAEKYVESLQDSELAAMVERLEQEQEKFAFDLTLGEPPVENQDSRPMGR